MGQVPIVFQRAHLVAIRDRRPDICNGGNGRDDIFRIPRCGDEGVGYAHSPLYASDSYEGQVGAISSKLRLVVARARSHAYAFAVVEESL